MAIRSGTRRREHVQTITPESDADSEGHDSLGDTKSSIHDHVIVLSKSVNGLRRPKAKEEVVAH
jgi:hypothetical protein